MVQQRRKFQFTKQEDGSWKLQNSLTDQNRSYKVSWGEGEHKSILYVGKVPVVKYFLNDLRPKDDPKKYQVVALINGVKPCVWSFETEDKAIETCFSVVDYFISLLNDFT